MPMRDEAARNASLDNDYGTTRGPNAPSAGHDLALFDGDPMTTGVEVAGGGYARTRVPHSKWLPATGGMKRTDGPVVFPAVTGEWDGVVTHLGLFWAGTEVLADTVPLAEPVAVLDPGPGPEVNVSIYYNDDAAGGTPS